MQFTDPYLKLVLSFTRKVRLVSQLLLKEIKNLISRKSGLNAKELQCFFGNHKNYNSHKVNNSNVSKGILILMQ